MSQENVELVRRMSEDRDLHAAADLHAWLVEFFDPEIEWHDAPSLPGAGVYYGREAVRRHVEDYLDAWSDARGEIEEIRSVGDRVIARIRYVGVGRQSGIELPDNGLTAVYDFRGGHILRVRQYEHESEALAAMGPAE
jgi:ketosteroid isomerase-like protein